MTAVFEREFRSYFQNITGWLFLAAYAVVYDIYYFYYNLYTGYAYISYPLSSIILFMVILIPILTMRSMAEDKKFKTNQLLYTAPVSVKDIVLGKYFAMASIFTFAMCFTCITPIILSMFGAVPFAANYTAVVGMWLFGLMAIAVGQFLSSLTENQIVAAVLSFAVLLIGYLMNTFAGLILSTHTVLINIMKSIAITSYLSQFNNAILSIRGIVYYITVGAFFLFLTCQLIYRSRTKAAGVKKGSIGLMVIGLAVLIAVNVGTAMLPQKITAIDASANKVFALSKTTEDFLGTVEKDVNIYVWGKESNISETIKYTLDRYDSGSKHVKVKYVDPSVSPTFYQAYLQSEPVAGTIIVESANRFKVISADKMYAYNFDTQTQQQYIYGYDGEGKLTQAINYVLGDEEETVYLISGHGENALETSYLNELEKQNYTVKTVRISDSGDIPENVAGIIINGPTRDFSKDEMEIIKKYFSNGGRALITTNYKAGYLDRLYDYLDEEYNIQLHTGMVYEGNTSKYYNQPMFIFPEVEDCDLTENISSDNHIMIPYAQGITMGYTSHKSIFTDLITTSASGYMKKSSATNKNYNKEEEDTDGPITIGANAINDETDADITVIGSYITFTEDADGVVAGNNKALFTGITGAFSKGGSRLSIPAKSYTVSNLSTNKSVSYALFGLLVFVVPILLLITGVVIWLRRRRR